jgi:hypothetical protein
MSPYPYPVIAVPLPMPWNPEMGRAWGNRDFLDDQRRHGAYMALMPLARLPFPTRAPPDPVPWNPSISRTRGRRRYFIDWRRHLTNDDLGWSLSDYHAFTYR